MRRPRPISVAKFNFFNVQFLETLELVCSPFENLTLQRILNYLILSNLVEILCFMFLRVV